MSNSSKDAKPQSLSIEHLEGKHVAKVKKNHLIVMFNMVRVQRTEAKQYKLSLVPHIEHTLRALNPDCL